MTDKEINLGDIVYTYCASSPYSLICGKVIEIHKAEKLKRGKRVVENKYCMVQYGKHKGDTWGTYHAFFTEREAAIHCLEDQKGYKRHLSQQLKCAEEAIANMEEILKKESKPYQKTDEGEWE